MSALLVLMCVFHTVNNLLRFSCVHIETFIVVATTSTKIRLVEFT